MEEQSGDAGTFLIGAAVQYWSKQMSAWVEADIEGRREVDGVCVYDLSCKRGVPASKLRPSERRALPNRVARALTAATSSTDQAVAAASEQPSGIASSSRSFAVGDTVHYLSGTNNRYVEAQVKRVQRRSDGSLVYDLTCKKAAPANRVFRAFKPGDRVEYWSASASRWLEARLLRIESKNGHCDLDIKKHAPLAKLRKFRVRPSKQVTLHHPPIKVLGLLPVPQLLQAQQQQQPQEQQEQQPPPQLPMRNANSPRSPPSKNGSATGSGDEGANVAAAKGQEATGDGVRLPGEAGLANNGEPLQDVLERQLQEQQQLGKRSKAGTRPKAAAKKKKQKQTEGKKARTRGGTEEDEDERPKAKAAKVASTGDAPEAASTANVDAAGVKNGGSGRGKGRDSSAAEQPAAGGDVATPAARAVAEPAVRSASPPARGASSPDDEGSPTVARSASPPDPPAPARRGGGRRQPSPGPSNGRSRSRSPRRRSRSRSRSPRSRSGGRPPQGGAGNFRRRRDSRSPMPSRRRAPAQQEGRRGGDRGGYYGNNGGRRRSPSPPRWGESGRGVRRRGR